MDDVAVTHTGRMRTPIKPGTARRLGLRRPGQWSDTMERDTRPGWGSTDVPSAWSETFGGTWSPAEVIFVPGSVPSYDELPGLEWGSCPAPRPLVNPREAAALRTLGLADNQFDVSPDLEKP